MPDYIDQMRELVMELARVAYEYEGQSAGGPPKELSPDNPYAEYYERARLLLWDAEDAYRQGHPIPGSVWDLSLDAQVETRIANLPHSVYWAEAAAEEHACDVCHQTVRQESAEGWLIGHLKGAYRQCRGTLRVRCPEHITPYSIEQIRKKA